MKYFVRSLSAVLLFAASCTKVTNPVTTEDWLRKGNWHLTSATAHNKSAVTHTDTVLPYTFLYKANTCNADNYLVFGSNHDGTAYPGKQKCAATESDNQSFYWELVNNNTTMNIYNADMFFGISSVRATVTSIDHNNFTLQYTLWQALPDPKNSHRTFNDTDVITAKFTNN